MCQPKRRRCGTYDRPTIYSPVRMAAKLACCLSPRVTCRFFCQPCFVERDAPCLWAQPRLLRAYVVWALFDHRLLTLFRPCLLTSAPYTPQLSLPFCLQPSLKAFLALSLSGGIYCLGVPRFIICSLAFCFILSLSVFANFSSSLSLSVFSPLTFLRLSFFLIFLLAFSPASVLKGPAEGSSVTCEICFSEIVGADCAQLPCGHPFCLQCWTAYLKEKITEQGTPVRL